MDKYQQEEEVFKSELQYLLDNERNYLDNNSYDTWQKRFNLVLNGLHMIEMNKEYITY